MTTKLTALTRRGHSLRNFSPREFAEMSAEGVEKHVLREGLRYIESGRFRPMLEATHKMFAHLDADERAAWAEANPVLMDWVAVYGHAEDLHTFGDYTDLFDNYSNPTVAVADGGEDPDIKPTYGCYRGWT